MRKITKIGRIIAISAGLFCLAVDSTGEVCWKHFRGMCDASALEMLNDDLFVVANDEDNVLRVYSLAGQGLPVQSLDFTSFYRLRRHTLEIDLEGAARIGDRIYWISSHGANSKGKFQPSRHRFFATQVITNDGSLRLAPVGQLYSGLLQDLVKIPALAKYRLEAASRKPPKASGALNIEGLAPTPEGYLLIGFRNPIPEGKALLVPLLNPEVVTAGQKASFGTPLLLDLNGLGIRSLTPCEGGYLIVAGSFNTEEVSHLYFWDRRSSKPTLLTDHPLPGNPEGIALVHTRETPSLFVLSDDGSRQIRGQDCKKLKDSSLKMFRGYEMPF